MFNPIHDLYSETMSAEEQAYYLLEMKRQAEIRRARAMAHFLVRQKTFLKKSYKKQMEESAMSTKSSIAAVKNQVEKAISGKCQEAIEDVVDDYLKLYDTIV